MLNSNLQIAPKTIWTQLSALLFIRNPFNTNEWMNGPLFWWKVKKTKNGDKRNAKPTSCSYFWFILGIEGESAGLILKEKTKDVHYYLWTLWSSGDLWRSKNAQIFVFVLAVPIWHFECIFSGSLETHEYIQKCWALAKIINLFISADWWPKLHIKIRKSHRL